MSPVRTAMHTCGSCRFWLVTEDPEVGECHCNAPAAGVLAVWPRCRATDWCGEWTEGTAPPSATGGTWNLDAETNRPDGPGIARFGTGDPANPGALVLSCVDAAGDDQTAWLTTIAANDLITLTETADATHWMTWQASAPYTVTPGAQYGTVECVAYNAEYALDIPCPVTLTVEHPVR